MQVHMLPSQTVDGACDAVACDAVTQMDCTALNPVLNPVGHTKPAVWLPTVQTLTHINAT